MVQSGTKILMIRFSSLGDVTQALSVPTRLAELGFPSEIHWVTRQDMAPLIQGHPFVTKIWKLDRSSGIPGLFRLIAALRRENFTHIYDAHNNTRSHLISLFLRPPLHITRLFNPPLFIRKPQYRLKRFFLFKFRINLFRKPFSGQRDLLEPLSEWGLSENLPTVPQIYIEPGALKTAKKILQDKNISHDFVVLAPSAAYPLKRWPLTHFKELIALMPEQKFVCLGGKEDHFISELTEGFSDQVLNLSGQTNLQESAAIISLAKYVVSNDTGLLHISEQLGKRTAALMGPAPFGFPSRTETTKIFEIDLPCRPCSKHGQGPCVNPEFQKCLVDIKPDIVAKEIRRGDN